MLKEKDHSEYKYIITVSRRASSPPLTKLTEIHTCKLCYSKPLTNLELTSEGKKLQKTIFETNKLFPEIRLSLIHFNPHNIKVTVAITSTDSDQALQLLKEALFRVKELSGSHNWLDNLKIVTDKD